MLETMRSNPLTEKTDFLDRAFHIYKIKSVVDMAYGNYAFHAVDRWPVEKAIVLDNSFGERTSWDVNSCPQIQIVSGDIANAEVAEKIGNVDAIIMQDIATHKGGLDWEEFLAMWSKNANHLIIYHQDRTQSDDVFNEKSGVTSKRLTQILASLGFKIDIFETGDVWSTDYIYIVNHMILATKTPKMRLV